MRSRLIWLTLPLVFLGMVFFALPLLPEWAAWGVLLVLGTAYAASLVSITNLPGRSRTRGERSFSPNTVGSRGSDGWAVRDLEGGHGDDVAFVAYRPGHVEPEEWFDLLVFVHRDAPLDLAGGGTVDPGEEVDRQATALLGAARSRYGDPVETGASGPVNRHAVLTFVPWLEPAGSVRINPPDQSVVWNEPIHRVGFRVSVGRDLIGRTLSGGVDVFAGMLLIGEIRFRVRVVEAVDGGEDDAAPIRGTAFRKIFASYSHEDRDVVQSVRRHVEALGDRYLVDSQALRSGEEWDDALLTMIRDADVFQLFWSTNSMRSEYVRREWEAALDLQRPHFVRPVYWEQPMPSDEENDLPPGALRKLHFAVLDRGGFWPGYDQGYYQPHRRGMALESRRVSWNCAVLVVLLIVAVGLVVYLALRLLGA